MNQILGENKRNSSIELLRLIAMWMIVMYHFHYHVLSVNDDSVLFKAAQIPLHIGVPVFILISGFFGIKRTVNGLSKLLSKTLFFSWGILAVFLVLGVFLDTIKPISGWEIIDSVFFLSRTNNLWFIRSYVVLYLLAPYINGVLSQQTVYQRFVFLLLLTFISVYIGIVSYAPEYNGRGILNFVLLYSIGRTIKEYGLQERLSFLANLLLIVVFAVLALIIYIPNDGTVIGRVVWEVVFRYNSPFMIIIAVLFFLLFARFRFYSKVINISASSVFAMYLIHENSIVNNYLYGIVGFVQSNFSLLTIYAFLTVYALVIMLLCFFLDKMTSKPQVLVAEVISFFLERIKTTLLGLNLRDLSHNSN